MAICMTTRLKIVREKESGKSLLSISEEHGFSYSTVKRVWQSYSQNGERGLSPKYDNCGVKRPHHYRVYRMSTMLKRKYPQWGAPYILTILSERYPDEKMPEVRTVQLWFRKHHLNKPKIIRPQSEDTPVNAVHDCWQIDAKENIILKDGTSCCYLTTVDVKSGIALEAPIFSP